MKVSPGKGSLPAYLYIRSGELIDADYSDLHGLDAALEIVSWDKTEIEMDGICRRQMDIIKMPMEHLLMEAFRLKDEMAEEGRVEAGKGGETDFSGVADSDVPTPAAKPAQKVSKQELERVVKVLQKEKEILEFAVFIGDKKLYCQPETCTLQSFDFNSLDAIMDEISTEMENEPRPPSLILHSAKRDRYLIFPWPQLSHPVPLEVRGT